MFRKRMTQLQMTCLSPIFKLPSPEKKLSILDKFGHVMACSINFRLQTFRNFIDNFRLICTSLDQFEQV